MSDTFTSSPTHSSDSPDSPVTAGGWFRRGERARSDLDLEMAEDAFRRALAMEPACVEYRLALATLLWDRRSVAGMVEVLDPIGPESSGFAAAENMRGFLAMTMGKARDARDCFRRALERAPNSVSYYSNFLISLLYDVNLSPEKIAKAHVDFGVQAAQAAGAEAVVETDRNPDRRLRVGFLSSDFRLHSVAFFLEPLLDSWNHEEAEVVLYSGVAHGDSMTALLEKHADRTVSLAGLPGDRLVEVIRHDRPDILIELGGHTANNFAPVLARRVAPVQLSWLGYPHSSGLRTIDGRLSDAYLEPLPGSQKFSLEPILHLPRLAFTYRMASGSLEVGSSPFERNGFPTFICCNNSAKISEPILALWIELLRRLPDARLLIKNAGFAYPPRAQEILSLFAAGGVKPERVEIHNHTASVYEHLQMYQKADIALDTYPYNGTTTTCEALWMGVPVVGLMGPSAVSRHTPRILEAVGLTDWITISGPAYVARAVAAVEDSRKLATLRKELRARIQASPLSQHATFAKGFQSVVRAAWQRHCANRSSGASASPKPTTMATTQLRREGIRAVERMQWEKAVEVWKIILDRQPDNAEALGYLGLIEKTRGNLSESLGYWEEAIKRSPKNPGMWGNLGEVLRHLRRLPEAEAALTKAVELKSDKHDARLGLATTQWDQRKIAEALDSLSKIPKTSSQWAGAKNMEGNIVSHLGYPAAAREAYQKAMEANPKSTLYHSNYLLSLLYDADQTGDSMAEAHRSFGKKHDKRANGVSKPVIDPQPEKMLRIGFFSADFRMHSVAFFFEPLLSAMDRQQFEIYLYSSVVNPDEMTHQLYAQVTAVRSMLGRTPESILAQAREDRLDIVVDLSGHTGNNALPIIAQGLAPVQCSWLGYPHSTGLSTIGYRLSDNCLEPLPQAQRWSSEEIVHLEDGCHSYSLPGAGIAVTPLPLSNAKGPTFICCNNSAKISPLSLDLFARVLEEVPQSRLILKNSGFTYAPRALEIQSFFASRGIEAGRVELRALTKTVRQHLETYCEADIALDTYPYNGTTTTCEALWMGLPVISLAGETAVSRHSASLLRQVDMAEWAVDSVEAYVRKAVESVADAAQLARMRAGLRDRFRASPLGDAAWFARRFEHALRSIWCDACEKEGADAASVASAREKSALHLKQGRTRHWLNRGRVAAKAGHAEEAAQWLRRAGNSGAQASAWIELGKLGEQCGRRDWSLEGWGEAVRAFPERADVWAARAEALRVDGCFCEACAAYEKAVSLAPDFPGVWMNFSAACRLANQPVRAEEAARKAIELKEDFPEAWNNLGGALRDQARLEEAIGAWIQALELRPTDGAVHSNLLYSLNAVPGLDAADLRAQHQIFGEKYFPDSVRVTHPVRARKGKAWRIGFLSPDLRDHSVAKFLRGVLPAMQRAGIETVAFADTTRVDAHSRALKAMVGAWKTVASFDDKALRNEIRAANVDVLVELSGHTAGHRLEALKERVAPLHLSWLGYPTALECGVTDFFVADSIIYPEAERPEEVLCLDGGALVYGPDLELPDCSFTDPDAPLTFGAFHSFHKQNEALWQDWSSVLEAFPGSRLKVKARALSDEALVHQWRRDLQQWCVPLDRVDLIPFGAAGGGHLKDWCVASMWHWMPRPTTGVTTTAEALVMGVPVVTIPGETPASRHAASLLDSAGYRQWIAADKADAIARIRKMVGDLKLHRQQRSDRQAAFMDTCRRRSDEWVIAFQSALDQLFQEQTTLASNFNTNE